MNIEQALALAYPADPESQSSLSIEVQCLLAEITGNSRPWILAHSESELTGGQENLFVKHLHLLQSGTPLAYLLGRQEFFGRSFRVNRATLIPRPETELLIELALAAIKGMPDSFRAVDVGTGSGCIGITLLCEAPGANVLALDPSLDALHVAARNAMDHRVSDRCVFVQASLLEPITGRFMLICANLPYIPTGRLGSLEVSRHEPNLALDGGEDGMRYIEPLIYQLPRCLHPAGSALFELDHGQGSSLHQVAKGCFPEREIAVVNDLSGQERVLVIGPEEE